MHSSGSPAELSGSLHRGILARWEPDIDRQVAELEARLIEIRRHLHAHPEPSREEKETSLYIAQHLSGAGLDAQLCRDGLGVIASATLGRPADNAPVIAIRADLDALRIQDTKTTSYASQTPGLCHACGHDAHATIVLGAALCVAACSRAEIGRASGRERG